MGGVRLWSGHTEYALRQRGLERSRYADARRFALGPLTLPLSPETSVLEVV